MELLNLLLRKFPSTALAIIFCFLPKDCWLLSDTAAVSCIPDRTHPAANTGICASTDQLLERCSGKSVEISTSIKNCGTFDGNWCCYNKSTHKSVIKASQSNIAIDTKDLLLVEVVHRHGERTNLFNIPAPGQALPSSFQLEAQLTDVGVLEMYQFGSYLRQRYSGFFDDGSRLSSQRIKVISSSTDRTIESADAVLAGLLPPNGTIRQWNSPLGSYWNPFPVYSQPAGNDSLLFDLGGDCPISNDVRGSITNLPIAKQLQVEMKDDIDAVKLATGIQNYNFFETSASLEDALRYQKSYPPVGGSPTWANTTVYNWLKRIADDRMHMLVGGNGDRNRTLLRVGVMLYSIFDNMNQSLQISQNGVKKLAVYSAHDENVAGILAAINLYNYTLAGPNFGIPEFSASVSFELYKNYTVRMLLKNNPLDEFSEPTVLIHPQCTDYCPLDKLRALLSDVIVSDAEWHKQCGVISGRKKRASAGLIRREFEL